MTQPPADLWKAAVAGDTAAFEHFYQRHADRVFAYLLRRIRDREDARDLTGEVFLVAWRRRAKVVYLDGSDILPWLLATANNVSRNHIRALSRSRSTLSRLALDPPPEDESATVIERQASAESAAVVMSVPRTLNRMDREVIELCGGRAPGLSW